jgi:hypothetical protein
MVALVHWLYDQIGLLVAAKLQRCASGACDPGDWTAHRGDLVG